MAREVPTPTETEVLANLLLGPDDGVEPLPVFRGGDLHRALDRVLVEALSYSPCVVSFSGGRDSSAILALACDAARRHGLDLPLPVTMRFPGEPLSDEARWQRLVLDHLGLRNAESVTLRDELDALGPIATEALRRHGLRWPFNAYMHKPVIDLAGGGAILTGIGGDELLSTTSPRRRGRQLVLAGLPAPLRVEISRRRHPPLPSPWLTAAGQARVSRAVTREEVRSPYRWDRALGHWYSSRAFAAMDGTLRLLAAADGVRVINPLLDRSVLSELAALGGKRGFASRTEAMQMLCGRLLPGAVIERVTKASFVGAVWGPAVREFLSTWGGEGVDARWVHVARLKAELTKPEPDTRAILLLHQAWLSSERRSSVSGAS
jgi:asparagine synthase (glutamine-hydrolysing)